MQSKNLKNSELMDHPNGIFGIRGYVWGYLTIFRPKKQSQNFKWPNFWRMLHNLIQYVFRTIKSESTWPFLGQKNSCKISSGPTSGESSHSIMISQRASLKAYFKSIIPLTTSRHLALVLSMYLSKCQSITHLLFYFIHKTFLKIVLTSKFTNSK